MDDPLQGTPYRIVRRLGSGARGEVLDFGVARILPGVSVNSPLPLSLPTEEGVLVGTPRYLSPEAASGQPVDHRADLYSAALVLYGLLAGRGPFDHIEDQGRVLSAHALENAQPPSQLASTPIPPELDRAVLKALRKDPARRFQSASEFDAALAEVATMLGQPQGFMETTVFDPSAPTQPRDPASATAPAAVPAAPRQLALFVAIFLGTALLVAALASLLLRRF